ncbi:YjfB family protein [Paenibacillus sp. BIC5C1]|uniref:YjfB family protein n=1 Tax=Paenibacillus sp. BIC5C1 TaxID=3078263 RepID=UPI0028EAA99D|nr:YjfB family protein [Paenibacillus sp. BIC5C1]
MDIAALSMAMSQVSVAQSASLQVMSMSKDMAEQQGQQLTEMLKSVPAAHPNLGGSLDISV